MRAAPAAACGLGLLLACAPSVRCAAADPTGMVRVPAGHVTMGAPDGDSDERPVHRVFVDAFLIDRCEVSNAQFRAFVAATGRSGPPRLQSAEEAPDAWPAVEVTWDEAAAYAAWAGKRLPTEAEWERAARGDDARIYPWGAAAPGTGRYGNFADLSARRAGAAFPIVPAYDDGFPRLAPVGSFPAGASPFGALDLAGNAFEWCADFYDAGYYERSAAKNPKGPDEGSSMVVRGGSWRNTGYNLRCANRSRLEPSSRSDRVGFRCAADIRDKSR